MKSTHLVLLGMLLAGSLAEAGDSPRVQVAQADPASKPAGRTEDEKAIRALLDAFVRAFDKGDARAIAAMFTEQGEAIDVGGEAVRGRKALETHYAQRFASSPGDKLETSVELIHFLAPSLARQDGQSKLIPTGGGSATEARYTATLLKDDGRWLIASIRELEQPSPTAHERLKELEWLVGDWVEETAGIQIATSVAWSEDKNFLLRSFEVRVEGKADFKGSQRIGWDPLTRQIKSWVFDSRGGHSEGSWTRSGERWVIKSSGVHPDGLTTSATQTLTRIRKDRLLWTSKDETLGEETEDEVQEFLMVRKPPQPK